MGGLDESLFGFIFESAKKAKTKETLESELRGKIRRMSSSFEDAVADMITDLVMDNIDYLSRIIIENNPHELAAKKADVLQMLLSNPKSRAILEAAKKQKRFVRWNAASILEATLLVLQQKGIDFSSEEIKWLYENVRRIGAFIYKPQSTS